MENPLGIGQPIPTGIITPTDIIPPQASIPSNVPAIGDVVELGALAEPMISATQLLTGMIFAPLFAWTSMTNSYLRFFDLSAHGTREV